MNSHQAHPWAKYSDDQLLKVRICDLNIELKGSAIEAYINQLYQELEAKGLAFRPKVYFGDEWFSPEGVPAISVPFYFAHARLTELEKSIILEVEGGVAEYFMKLLRHEAGHCFDHAYQFSKRPKWKKIFGSSAQEYHPETYRPRPYSRGFVRNLDNWYAQAHPDEDFAETFAVWLDPQSDWKNKYKKWPKVLSKLEFIDLLAKQSQKKKPRKAKSKDFIYSSDRLRRTLEKYYQKRKKDHAEDYPNFYDDDLKKIFNGDSKLPKKKYSAELFMKKNQKEIVKHLGYWTKEKKYTIQMLLKRLAARCKETDLRLGKSETETRLQVVTYLTTLIMSYLFTGKFKRSV